MSKLRIILAILRTRNYIVITDHISDGYVEPQYASDFLGLVEPVADELRLTTIHMRRGANR